MEIKKDGGQMRYSVHETFYTFQGEGVHMGRPAFFIRLFGCPIHCPWCDSAGTWHRDFVPNDIARMPVEAILECIAPHKPDFVVLTGGEPTVHYLAPLLEGLTAKGYPVHLETSGAYTIHFEYPLKWITLSPKRWKLPLAENYQRANEFKVIVEAKEDIAFYSRLIGETNAPIWLHPEWSKREDPVVLGAISDAVKEGQGRYRAGWQLHKLYRVDARDSRSRPVVPLGGDLRKGY